MSKDFLTVHGCCENTTVIERSKFICKIKGVENEEQAKEFIASVKKEHSIATHNCYAYIADDKCLVQKFSDDGEPQGTAGFPMLEMLKGRKVCKVVAVVTRYFGGVKLGTGGLARAYGGAVADCLDRANIVCYKPAILAELTMDYEFYSKFLNLIDENVVVSSTQFDSDVKICFRVQSAFWEYFKNKINDTFSGKIVPCQKGAGYYPFGVK